jgi:hypothetical protein
MGTCASAGLQMENPDKLAGEIYKKSL